MSLKYATLVPGRDEFDVLGLLRVTPSFGPLWFNAFDVDHEYRKGVMFAGWDSEATVVVGTLTVVDITSDPDEPDVEALSEEEAAAFDRFLEQEVRRLMPKDGGELHRWMGTCLERTPAGPNLVSAYIVRNGAEDWEYTARRLKIRDRKVAALAAWQIARSTEVANPRLEAVRKAYPLQRPKGEK